MSKKTIHLTLKPNERIFLNGAVLRVDRKVTFELLNDATFLLEGHVLQVEDTDTPLKQLYFSAQLMLINPSEAEKALTVFVDLLKKLLQTFTDCDLLKGLKECIYLTEQNKIFEVLKVLRSLFQREEQIMGKISSTHSTNMSIRQVGI
ncbi:MULTISPECIES: flagellar biosynthesis repressor FlbT [unclassified Bartonella]|uniref:flagellar biosynthesis repressor FlbT n=1 Tax=unclassified Bartonella TaxID=2645622 RepID=UPI0009C309B1|nr:MULTISPECIES: flagellar biosynthesis repressor FlbT [unclassified Bartonella]AQX27752.1 flagellar protein FlbT [Bartonella sp. JB15]AQX29034.1 flagellar protein FlbT [Bartonella sp. JB63]